MNERILELADKAIEDMPGAWNIPDAFCEKFAKLIVQACADIADEYDLPKMSGPGMIIANRIRDQFGVDENE